MAQLLIFMIVGAAHGATRKMTGRVSAKSIARTARLYSRISGRIDERTT